jgi:hypothetical protein
VRAGLAQALTGSAARSLPSRERNASRYGCNGIRRTGGIGRRLLAGECESVLRGDNLFERPSQGEDTFLCRQLRLRWSWKLLHVCGVNGDRNGRVTRERGKHDRG